MQIEFEIIIKKMAFNLLFYLNVFETILSLDSGNSSSKTNIKSYLKVKVPGNQKNLQTGNSRAIPKTLNSDKSETVLSYEAEIIICHRKKQT